MNWQERAEKAEAELERLREQEPVAYVKYKATGGNVGLAWMAIPTQVYYPREGEPLYAGPVPAAPRKYHEFASVMLDAQPFITAETYGGRYIVAMRFERLGKMQDCHAALLALLQSAPQAPAVPELDPMTRLIVSDPKQLKPKKQEPAVPSVVFMAHNKTSSVLFAARKDADQFASSCGPAAGVAITECAVIGSQSATQAPAVPQNELVAAITVYLKADDEMHQATRRTGFGGMGKPVASEAEQRHLAAIRHAARGDLEALLQSAEVKK